MTTKTLYELHAELYEGMPEGTVINVCEMSSDDARLVSENILEVAQALGHTHHRLEAAQEGDTHYINQDLTARFQVLLATYEIEEV